MEKDTEIRMFCVDMAVSTPVYTEDGNKGYASKAAVIETAQAYYDFVTGKEVTK